MERVPGMGIVQDSVHLLRQRDIPRVRSDMAPLKIDEFLEEECASRAYSLQDYEGDTPRWCKGCGDFGVLTGVQKLLRDNHISPENVVCVSGIGCSSRFPHYLKTFGLHGIHGRALPLATGVALARPDLHVIAVMGDGDCFSIGAGHWVHAVRYNVNITVLVLDNEIYALTKKQASPTTAQGVATSTTPHGSFLESLNPLSVVLGISNVSFVAQTATWLAAHMEATLAKAWEHRGLSFVRFLQRCPVFMPQGFGDGGKDFPVTFLESEDEEGIPVHKGFMKKAPTVKHDHRSLKEAQQRALETSSAALGLIYSNPDLPTYEEIRLSGVKTLDRKTLVADLNTQLEKHAVTR